MNKSSKSKPSKPSKIKVEDQILIQFKDSNATWQCPSCGNFWSGSLCNLLSRRMVCKYCRLDATKDCVPGGSEMKHVFDLLAKLDHLEIAYKDKLKAAQQQSDKRLAEYMQKLNDALQRFEYKSAAVLEKKTENIRKGLLYHRQKVIDILDDWQKNIIGDLILDLGLVSFYL